MPTLPFFHKHEEIVVADDWADIIVQLKQAREFKKLSAQQVSDAIHIRRKYLESLENGDYHLLPGAAYIKGYIILYANYVGVSLTPELSQQEHEPKKEFKQGQLYLENIAPETWQLSAGVLGFLLLSLYVSLQ